MSKKICLITFDDITHAASGYIIRVVMVIDKLKKQGNKLTIIQFGKENSRVRFKGCDLITVETDHQKIGTEENLVSKLIGFKALKEVGFHFQSRKLIKDYRNIIEESDEVYIEGCMFYNVFKEVSKINPNIVLDTHCLNKDIGIKMRKNNYLTGSIRTIIWHHIENKMINGSKRVIAVSSNDKDFIIKHYKTPAEKIEIIPNAVEDANYKKFEKEAKTIKKSLTKKFKNIKHIALFIADLAAVHNVEAEKFILKNLSKNNKDVLFLFVGNNPNNHKNTRNVMYTGYVKNIDPYIILADICVAPLAIGSGVKTKVLDYLKYDKKVVATEVAMEGIDDNDLVTVSDLESFSESIQQSL